MTKEEILRMREDNLRAKIAEISYMPLDELERNKANIQENGDYEIEGLWFNKEDIYIPFKEQNYFDFVHPQLYSNKGIKYYIVLSVPFAIACFILAVLSYRYTNIYIAFYIWSLGLLSARSSYKKSGRLVFTLNLVALTYIAGLVYMYYKINIG